MAEELTQTESQPKRYQYERRNRKDYLTKKLNDFFAVLDLRDVERQTRIHRSHIRSYLNGTALPSLPILAVLHSELGLDLNELVKEPKGQNESDIVHEISNEPKTETLTTLSEAGLL